MTKKLKRKIAAMIRKKQYRAAIECCDDHAAPLIARKNAIDSTLQELQDLRQRAENSQRRQNQ